MRSHSGKAKSNLLGTVEWRYLSSQLVATSTGSIAHACLILDHMFLEFATKPSPELRVESAVRLRAASGGVSHRYGVMRVVVREQTLTPECQEAIDRR